MEAGLHDAQYPEVVPLRTRASAAGGLNPSRRCPEKTAGGPQNSLIRFASMELQPQRSAPLDAFIRSATGNIEPRWLIPDRLLARLLEKYRVIGQEIASTIGVPFD